MMWADNETDRDFLNFTGVADTVAEIIVQAGGKPISIGVSGAWGVGKSSMIRLIRRGLAARTEGQADKFIFVEFNAWLYQGYDDVRAALLEVIATTLATEAHKRKTGIDKAQELLKRVNWLRAAKLVAPAALALAFGLPPPGLAGEIFDLGKKAVTGGLSGDDVTQIGKKERRARQFRRRIAQSRSRRIAAEGNPGHPRLIRGGAQRDERHAGRPDRRSRPLSARHDHLDARSDPALPVP
jgi:predicted KAP-like P-loop ATPase